MRVEIVLTLSKVAGLVIIIYGLFWGGVNQMPLIYTGAALLGVKNISQAMTNK